MDQDQGEPTPDQRDQAADAEGADLEEQADAVADFVEELLERMGIDAIAEPVTHRGHVYVDIVEGPEDDMALLIGRHGQTLDAIQELARTSVGRRLDDRIRVLVDVGDYRKRQEDRLIEHAREVAERVRSSGEEERLDPMNAYERKLVHDVVAEFEELESSSEGVDPDRFVVVRVRLGGSSGRPRKAVFHVKHEGWTPEDAFTGQVATLGLYEELLLGQAVPRGIVAASDSAHLRTRHILDSLRAVPHIPPSAIGSSIWDPERGSPASPSRWPDPSWKSPSPNHGRREPPSSSLAVEKLQLLERPGLRQPGGGAHRGIRGVPREGIRGRRAYVGRRPRSAPTARSPDLLGRQELQAADVPAKTPRSEPRAKRPLKAADPSLS